MKKMDSAAIRSAFLDFFAQQDHQVVQSSSLVPGQDPSLLFTNAGMVQFKEVFLGTEQRSYQRATSVQRCVRAGGKHNDLENVGFTTRHHTFFEMLGNFSFGDYFKLEAIQMAWNFLTKVLRLPQDRLWVTVYEEDLESEKIWIETMGLSPSRVVRCGAKDNFWAMGDTGPCGPCTEIYYDHGPEIAGGPPGSAEMDGDRYVEIWNVVFMQFNRDQQGILHPLPQPSVDTGMGLERIAAVMQAVTSNYDTDIFLHLKNAIQKLAPNIDRRSASVQVIADHIRAICFLLADDVIPSHEGRGYVLRRIIRRAVRHGQKLGLPSPSMYRLVPAVIEKMGEAYPHLKKQQSMIERYLKQEEEQFIRTIHQGLKLLQESMAECHHRLLPGDVVFKLYDTYGFPVDLTNDAAREAGFQIDMAGFEACMQAQRQQSQAATAFQTHYLELPAHWDVCEFQGYDKNRLQSKVQGLLTDGKNVRQLKAGQSGMIILVQTPFYAESGGQIGDEGRIVGPEGEFIVTDTQSKGELILHIGYMLNGSIQENDIVNAQIDMQKRQAIRLNHTATHLLHAALRDLFGDQVLQKGSLVTAERSRFDFSLQQGLNQDELYRVEQWVNEKVRENVMVETEYLSLDEAQSRGAMALFGEKYQEEVRVLRMGQFSQELCGGTHAVRTGDIGMFKILSESSIASGVRRIDFVTGELALKIVQEQNQLITQMTQLVKTSPEHLVERIHQTQQQIQQLQQHVLQLEKKGMLQKAREWLAQQSGHYMIRRADEYDIKSLRVLSDLLNDLNPQCMFILYAIQAESLNVMVSVPKILQSKVGSAADWVKIVCPRGGGRPDFAQGGGAVPTDLDEKFKNIIEKLNHLTV